MSKSRPLTEPGRKVDGRRKRWAPRIWLGMDCAGWARLLWRNGCAVQPHAWHSALIDSIASAYNTEGRWLQDAIWGGAIRRMQMDSEPLFILGHWRCGTTLLHELLIRDARHTFPNTYMCLAPNHFRLTQSWLPKLLFFLVPEERPMDSMPLGWDRPQEDEFAICNLGLPSPYLTLAFPNHPPQYPEYLDLEGIEPEKLKLWKRRFLRFLEQIYQHSPKRIVLKSPPHTARVKVLLEMFPNAKFVHITRHPFAIYPSTLHLWKTLYQQQGLQRPKFAGLEEHVLDTMCRMYRSFEASRDLIPERNLFELKYEDLVADPLRQMADLYQHLQLGEFEALRPALEKYFGEEAKDYKTNRYRISDEDRQTLLDRWGFYFERYGYTDPQRTPPPSSVEVADLR